MLLKTNVSKKEIADYLGVNLSTIYREIKRGAYLHRNTDWTETIRYSADKADYKYRQMLKEKGSQIKLGNDYEYAEYLERKIIEEKQSPKAVLGHIKKHNIHFNTTISVNTLYSYIRKGYFSTLEMKHLPRGEQKKKKQQLQTAIKVISVLVVIGIFAIIFLATGAFDYQPKSTYDVLITIENYGSLHVELYGNDAPETVAHFLSLVNSGYYNGKSVFKLFDDLAYLGDGNASDAEHGIKGEFSDNGFNNKISHKRGIISMARGEDYDSAYGQFFIVRKNSTDLNGKYAAFGKITSGMEIIDNIYKNLKTDENGMISEGSQPIITSIESHASHSH